MRTRTAGPVARALAPLLVALVAVVPVAVAAPAGGATTPAPVLDRARHGQDAVIALGRRLPTVAARNGWTAARLRTQLRSDPTLWIDRSGRAFYVEPTVPQAAGTPDGPYVTTPAPYPYAQTFLLHSRPGSSRTIYLDFNGFTVSGTAWNGQYGTPASFDAAPFDEDGNSATFSNAEQDIIQSIWLRISEDYAPFDVDVTTQDPGQAAITRSSGSDAVYGTRLVITSSTYIQSACGCGGIAYVGVFSDSSNHDYYQPAFAFQQGLGGNNASAKTIAEAGAHEVGHNLGLSHDGTASVGYYSGQGSWAPIMGVSYSKPISQWSKGEYSGANNTEDDLAVMQANGAPLMPDDYGNTSGTATDLGYGPTLSASGLVTSATDVDFVKFTAGAGSATISVNPAPTSPDLDVRIDLYDSNGNLVTFADPPSGTSTSDVATGMSATITTTLTAGTYSLKVDGVGAGSASTTGYSDYASIGRWVLSGTIPQGGLTIPNPPTNVTATTYGSGVLVSWTDASTDETGFQVLRWRQDPRRPTRWYDSTLIATLPANTTSVPDLPGTGRVRYDVRATGTGGSSAWVQSGVAAVARLP